MTIILCIALWLLSGFLAAWIAHNIDDPKPDMSNREVFWVCAFGGFSLALTLIYVIFFASWLNKPFFKAKEPK
jgi:uncharacterized membrane protein